MGKNYISKKGMEYEKWLEARQKGIGSSDVAAILGVNPFKTPLQLWFDKTEPIKSPGRPSLAARMGIAMEDSIATIYMEESGLKVQKDNKIRFHPEHPVLMANIDRMILGDPRGPGVLEIKFTSSRALKYWEADIPRFYFTQVQHQLSVTGWTWGQFVVFVGDRYDLRIVPFERDEEIIKLQNERCLYFWNEYVLKGEPPPAEASDLDLISHIEGSTIPATDEILTLRMNALLLKSKIGELETEEEVLVEQIKKFMGDNEALVDGQRVVATYKMPKESVVIDQARLKAEMPEIADKYAKTRKASRRFQLREETDNAESA